MTVYSRDYFNRFQHISGIKKWLLSVLVDRKQPLFSVIQRHWNNGSRLLDFGCGSGLFGAHIAPFVTYLGMDVSKDAIALARENAPGVSFQVGAETQLAKFNDASFDIITCFDVLEHLNSVEPVLASFHRVLSKNGWLVIAVPVTGSVAYSQKGKHWFGYEDKTHVRLWDRNKWLQTLSEQGFAVSKIYSCGLVNTPQPPYRLTGWLNLLHLLTQALGTVGVSLPPRFSDEDYYICVKGKKS